MRRELVVLGIAAFVGLGLIGPIRSAPAQIQDAESATHGDEAASYQIIGTYEFAGGKVIQFDLAVLSHFSYMLISDNECLVVDPGRDITTYLQTAQKEGCQIKAVYLTHSHADFVAGHVEFAQELGVPIYISVNANAQYEHQAIREGDTIEVGQAMVRILDTPGHTPDCTCGVLFNRQNVQKPLMMFTGDTLFVGSVGRPDLLGENMSAATLASQMFDTWTQKLSKLPDDVLILPAHGAGSLCGAHLSDEPTSTIGQQKVSNTILQHENRGEFIAAILDGLPEAPQYFKHNAAMNRQGPKPVDWNPPELPLVAPSTDLLDIANYYVVDVRDAASYAAGHIPNSVNIALRGRFETWVGIMVPWEANAVLVGSEDELQEAVYRLHRVGYEPQCLPMDQWTAASLPIKTSKTMAPRDLYSQMQSSESPIVVDVRLPSEWMALRIGTVVNIPLSHLAQEAVKLDRTQPIIAVCNSAYRSSLAIGVLERLGFEDVRSMTGGSEAWIEAGLPVYEATAAGPAAVPKREIHLPDRISPSALKGLMMDLPGTFQLVDVRPPDHFADYSLPGSENVDVAELLYNPAYLTGAGPLIIVCRDGSLAMMVAGVLSQKTQRNIKALHGGLEAYWSESGVAGAVIPTTPAAGIRTPARDTISAPASQPAAPIVSPKRKKAGC